MSVCRFNRTCDVYVFFNTDDLLECCGCGLLTERVFLTSDPETMREHLREHVRAGHQVPTEVFEEGCLESEMDD